MNAWGGGVFGHLPIEFYYWSINTGLQNQETKRLLNEKGETFYD